MPRPLIVFSDLDGTLLDHETYSFAAAEPALAMLRSRGVPLILASSKTAAEIAPLRERTGFPDCPAIVENGAGILEPAGRDAAQSDTHGELLAALNALPDRLRIKFSGFSDWSIEEIAEKTGLSPGEAELAAARFFSEPGLWTGTDDERAEFEAQLSVKGVTARQGGRFLTLSFDASKASRMHDIAMRYTIGDIVPFMVALGDAPNDIEMLETADIGVIVANPHGSALPVLPGESDGRVIRTEKSGPEGWNQAVLEILQRR
jgi:mannosyl-3-phosphoglycerate phosphatase